MYSQLESVPLKSSASLLHNNFDYVESNEDETQLFAVVHKSLCWVFDPTQAVDAAFGANAYKKVICKGEGVHSSTLITQAKWCVLPQRTLFVVTSVKGAQMFEVDGSIMVFWQALGPHPTSGQAQFARGITSLCENYICIGTADGSILVFDVPSKGNAVKLQETLKDHSASITDLHGHNSFMISGDDCGNITLWKASGHFHKLRKIKGYDSYPATSIRLWKTMIVAGYASGHIRVINAETGVIMAELAAHARWVNAIDIAENTGLLISASEDSHVRVWDLNKMSLSYQHLVENQQLTGARFLDRNGSSFALTAYDSSEVFIFKSS